MSADYNAPARPAKGSDPFAGLNPLGSLWLASGSSAGVSGNLSGLYFFAPTATPFTQLGIVVTVAAIAPAPTLSRLAVYKAAPNGDLLEIAAATADDPALFMAAGGRYKQVTSGSEVSAGVWRPTLGQFYFACELFVTAGGLPSFAANPTMQGGTQDLAPLTGRVVGLADLPASAAGVVLGTARQAMVVAA